METNDYVFLTTKIHLSQIVIYITYTIKDFKDK